MKTFSPALLGHFTTYARPWASSKRNEVPVGLAMFPALWLELFRVIAPYVLSAIGEEKVGDHLGAFCDENRRFSVGTTPSWQGGWPSELSLVQGSPVSKFPRYSTEGICILEGLRR